MSSDIRDELARLIAGQPRERWAIAKTVNIVGVQHGLLPQAYAAADRILGSGIVGPGNHDDVSALSASIHLGYETEAGDPERAFTKPPSDHEIDWLSSWLAGEGWTRARS